MIRYVKFAELPVEDQDRALHFYTGKLDFRVAEDAPYKEGWRWIELEIPGADTRILLTERYAEHLTDIPRLVLVAEDIDTTYKKLAAKGVEFTQAPTEAPWSPGERFAQFIDSEGNGIVIGSH